MIKDSGERRQFDSGAVRDIQDGKGRCDLLPLDVVAFLYEEKTTQRIAHMVFNDIWQFTQDGSILHLANALERFMLNCDMGDCNWSTLFLEISKHFEDGAKKYGENNWQKGIPTRCYIDSGVRHYLKWLRGDDDEPHNRAFVWNMICCMWTCIHKPELNDYRKEKTEKDK